ncbi:hypothetical protein G7Y89_g10664 [Cudoniella acicularis]|uniref:Uncharacterized protein n=1 Tax=Cudoniella acicularis TaxID=354080 RepID=A0A8H4RF16_9HELO|nr:hypothetical protein G7Y89_g10664 [Cudoniella acicularis]
MSTRDRKSLPPELWNRVISNFNKEQDLPALWTTLRHVNTTFRDIIESIFRTKHLRKTFINFHLGEKWTDEIGRIVLNLEYNFSHLSNDQRIAIFETDVGDPEYTTEIRQRLKGIIADQERLLFIESPPFNVQIHRELNDTPIPGLSIDFENFNLSCDWRGLFTRFFGEEQIYHKYLTKWSENNKAWATRMGDQAARGEIDMMTVIQNALESFAGASDESRKKARRARLNKQGKEQGKDWDWDVIGDENEDKLVLKRIAEARQLASMGEDSDFDEEEDEEGEEDEDGDEDDEDDEWEDASDNDETEDGESDS